MRTTPLHQEHQALGGRLVPFAGWEMPVQYAGLVKEHHAVRQAAGLFDVSHMGELELEGPETEAVIDGAVSGDLSKLPVGKALYTVACNERGTILDDLIVYRRGAERFLIVCNASNRDKIAAHIGALAAGRCSFRDASDDTALIALQGPKAIEVARRAGASESLLSLDSFCLADGELAGAPVLAARTGYTAEDGFEIFARNEHAVKIWRALLEAGKDLGIEPAGLGARDTLRLEGRLSLYGNEIDETTNPLEAGLGWVVKLDKERDFLGKSALIAIKAAGLSRRLVGFEMVGRGIGRHGYPIVEWKGDASDPNAPMGVVTSGSPGPTVGKNIGLGYVPADKAAVGTSIGIEIRGKVIEAVVVKTPFYKRAR